MGTIGRKQETSSPVPGTAAGLSGGVVFILALFAFGLPWWVAVLAATGGFFAGFLLFSPRKKRIRIQAEGVTPEMIEKALEEGRRNIRELEEFRDRITSSAVREDLEGIRSAAERILDEIEKDPQDVKTARPFLNYHFVATMKILRKYVELAEREVSSPGVRGSLDKVENSLAVIRRAFEKQHERLLENDILDLDAEVAVLEKTIRMEGLGKDE